MVQTIQTIMIGVVTINSSNNHNNIRCKGWNCLKLWESVAGETGNLRLVNCPLHHALK